MRLYMPRFHVGSMAANIAAMKRDSREAAEQGCDIVVFPEMFLTAYQGENNPEVFRDNFNRISDAFAEVLFVFGAISEDGYNRMPVYLGGRQLAQYDKVHLFEPNDEHRMWQAGARYVAVRFRNLTIGLATCNDVRFPEQSRALRLEHDAAILIYPALWPWERDHIWSALLRARAIENGVFCAGCCISSVDNGSELFDGAGNHVFDPLGNPVAGSSRVYELNQSLLKDVLVDTGRQFRKIDTVDLIG